MTEYLRKKLQVLSFLLITFIVYLHADNREVHFVGGSEPLDPYSFPYLLQLFVYNGLGRLSVPIFLSVSGYRFFINLVPSGLGYLRKFQSRFVTLFVPYAIWSALSILLFYTLQGIPITRPYFTHVYIKDLSVVELLDILLIHPLPSQLWFLRNLILYVLCTPLIYLLIKRVGGLFVLILFIIWMTGLDHELIRIRGVAFFCLGSYLAIRKPNINLYPSVRPELLVLVWFVMTSIQTFWEAKYGYSIYIYVFHNFSVIVGGYALWYVYDTMIVRYVEKLLPLSRYTFLIFVAHEPIQGMLIKVLIRSCGVSSLNNLVIFLLTPLVTISLLIVVGEKLRRRLPLLYGVLTGGRGL